MHEPSPLGPKPAEGRAGPRSRKRPLKRAEPVRVFTGNLGDTPASRSRGQRDPYEAMARAQDRVTRPTSRDRRLLSAYNGLIEKGLTHDEAVAKLRPRSGNRSPYEKLLALGFTREQAVEFLREQAQRALEDRAEFLRERNKREGPSYRKMIQTRRARGNVTNTGRDPATGRFC